MDEAIENFSKQLSQGAVGLFYYAGHGVQVDGENYLIPIDAQLKRERHVIREAISLSNVLKFMEEAESEVNIVIVDACRDNPFYRQWRSTRGSTAVRGLSSVDLPPQGTIIAFSTAPGDFAEDGQNQRNSPFTSNLLDYIKTPNLEVADMFRQVRAAVLRETDELQRPWYRESLIGSFFFKSTDEVTLRPQTNADSTTTAILKPKPDNVSEETSTDSNTTTVTQPSPSIIDSSEPETILISKATGVDYTQLRDLLAARKWKEADRETSRMILRSVGAESGFFTEEDLNKLSCKDLRIIDRLWLDSSQGKFGLSVQKEIWQNNGSPTADSPMEIWRQFYIDLGWKTEESGIESDLGYSSWLRKDLHAYNNILTSKKGGLPRLYANYQDNYIHKGGTIFFSRCEL